MNSASIQNKRARSRQRAASSAGWRAVRRLKRDGHVSETVKWFVDAAQEFRAQLIEDLGGAGALSVAQTTIVDRRRSR